MRTQYEIIDITSPCGRAVVIPGMLGGPFMVWWVRFRSRDFWKPGGAKWMQHTMKARHQLLLTKIVKIKNDYSARPTLQHLIIAPGPTTQVCCANTPKRRSLAYEIPSVWDNHGWSWEAPNFSSLWCWNWILSLFCSALQSGRSALFSADACSFVAGLASSCVLYWFN